MAWLSSTRLQQQFTALWTSVGIGALWGLWHVPMILAGLGDFTVFWEYMLNIMVMSIILGWLYNSTNAALPVVMITHASHNMPQSAHRLGIYPVFSMHCLVTQYFISSARRSSQYTLGHRH